MPQEYRYIDGTLRAGYFCTNCGQSCGGYGHFIGSGNWSGNDFSCQANKKLVEQLRRANPSRGVKPHYILKHV